MYSQQVAYLLNFLMLIEGALVIAAGYLAHYIRWILGGYLWGMPTDLFFYSVLFLMFVNNFLIGRMELYSDQRPKSFWQVVQKLVLVIFLDFALLSVGYYLLKLDVSRGFIAIYAAILLLAFLLERGLLEVFLNTRQE